MDHLLENKSRQQRHREDHASGRQDEEGGVTRGSPGPLGTASPPDGSLGGLRAGRGHGGWELTDGVHLHGAQLRQGWGRRPAGRAPGI